MSAVAEPTPLQFNNAASRYISATRLPFLSVTLIGALLGLAVAVYSGQPFRLMHAGLAIFLALVTHAAVNVLNDYYDALNGTDDANTGRLYPFTGGSRFIQNGVLTPGQTACYGYALLALAMAGGLWLAVHVGVGLLLIGAAGLFIGWAYSATPFRLNSRGLGEFCVLAGFVGIVVGMDFVLRGHFDRAPFLIGLPYGLLVTNLLFINQFPDREADAMAGKRHWVVRFSPPMAAGVYPLLSGLALGMIVMLWQRNMIPPMALFSALPLLISFNAAYILRRNVRRPSALLPAIRMTIVVTLAHGILLALALMSAS